MIRHVYVTKKNPNKQNFSGTLAHTRAAQTTRVSLRASHELVFDCIITAWTEVCHDDEKKWFAVLSLLYRVPALPSEDDRNVTSRLQSSTFARASALFSTTLVFHTDHHGQLKSVT